MFAALVGALVLLHVVFAGEGFVARRAMDVLLPRVFLAVAAAWPEVVKVSVQPTRFACGHGYFFFEIFVGLALGGVGALVDELAPGGTWAAVDGGLGSICSVGA